MWATLPGPAASSAIRQTFTHLFLAMCSTSGQLHSQLHAAIACVSTDSDLSHRIWQAVQESYGAPTRHYHNLQHLHEMLAWLERAAAAGALPSPQPPAVVLAVFFHDIVYDAQRHDNEEASALLAQRMLLEAGAEEQVNSPDVGSWLVMRSAWLQAITEQHDVDSR